MLIRGTLRQYARARPGSALNNRAMHAARRYASTNSPRPRFRLGKRSMVLGALGLGATGLYLTVPDVQYGVQFAGHAAQRSWTIISAVSRCLYYYQRFLNTEFDDSDLRFEELSRVHQKCANIAFNAIERNRGIFIKLGQHIAALTYVFPDEWTQTMIPLQDRAPVSSIEEVEQLFEDDGFGKISDLFLEFEPKPFGTASLAQVHRARLKDGEMVAVKVQHPSLKAFIPLDIALVREVFDVIDYWFPNYSLKFLSEEMQRSIYVELDFREEARNAERTAEHFRNKYQKTALRIPKVHWADRRLLCMEFVSGGRPDDLQYLNEHNIDRAELSRCFSHIFDEMIFTPDAGLHCDPHGGNIAIRPLSPAEQITKRAPHNFEVVLYDHGLYRYVPTSTRRAYAHLWLALLSNDQPNMRKYAMEFAHIGDEEFRVFTAAVTGRSFNAVNKSVVSVRGEEERHDMMRAIIEQNLVGTILKMLNKMPPVVLLIFKTNDLIRYLDEQLGTPLGVRSFLIMARYCLKTVYMEQLDLLRQSDLHVLGFTYWKRLVSTWCRFTALSMRLSLYELYAYLRPHEANIKMTELSF